MHVNRGDNMMDLFLRVEEIGSEMCQKILEVSSFLLNDQVLMKT